MSTTIHHATAKRAKALGIELRVEENRVVAVDGQAEFSASTATKAMDAVMTARNKDAQRNPTPKASKSSKRKVKPAAGDEGDEGDEDDEEKVSHSIVPPRYKAKYAPTDDTNDDGFAHALAEETHDAETGELDLKALYRVAAANGVHTDRWVHLNPGQQRMCIGNVLRGLQRHGKDVVIGDDTFAGLPQPEKKAKKAPKAKKPAKRAKKAAK